ncbi:glucose-6-phosphate isomerase [Sphingoaurantiacus capsulatus]|uniref:Glucose-6-phosphate isomerase n=1 Tax=Sphingoaurantiacus capsulatus TaxID=1771310 RepID=A0ABV7X920_9SPHN
MDSRLPQTPEWQALAAHAAETRNTHILSMFDAEQDRLANLSIDLAGLHFDFSKLRADAKAVELLGALASAANLAGWRAKLLAGGVVNPSEGRAATHAAERSANADHGKMRDLVEAVRGGRHGDIRYVLHIGIGGSALGPALLLDALGRKGDGPEVAVVANIDGVALEEACARFDPAHTLIVLVSKTFTTIETMTNAAGALDWLRAGGVANPVSRCIAVTAAPVKAEAFGIADDRILPFAETVGGRYSLWSAVGVPFALRNGWDAFAALLAGASAMDEHFAEAPFAGNAPALAAALDIWHATLLGAETRAVFGYDERLRLLPSYLQQLEMESNGKRVTRDGAPVGYPTGAITWGGVGTDAQHAVFQLVHQGTHLIPVEFLAVIEPGHARGGTHHRQLLANCFAQGAALLKGRTHEEALAKSGGDAALAEAKTFPGNRPSSTILLDQLDPRTLGALLAFYEHRTFAAAVLLGTNPFDQWGVELGKEMAKALEAGDTGAFDPSTADLLRRAFG